MTEKILVFKGGAVVYCSCLAEIRCCLEDDCFKIKDVYPNEVVWDEAWTITVGGSCLFAVGRELWSDGERWIIRH